LTVETEVLKVDVSIVADLQEFIEIETFVNVPWVD
jgi:hypothetical protein